jgi:hypothetical protein
MMLPSLGAALESSSSLNKGVIEGASGKAGWVVLVPGIASEDSVGSKRLNMGALLSLANWLVEATEVGWVKFDRKESRRGGCTGRDVVRRVDPRWRTDWCI